MLFCRKQLLYDITAFDICQQLFSIFLFLFFRALSHKTVFLDGFCDSFPNIPQSSSVVNSFFNFFEGLSEIRFIFSVPLVLLQQNSVRKSGGNAFSFRFPAPDACRFCLRTQHASAYFTEYFGFHHAAGTWAARSMLLCISGLRAKSRFCRSDRNSSQVRVFYWSKTPCYKPGFSKHILLFSKEKKGEALPPP